MCWILVICIFCYSLATHTVVFHVLILIRIVSQSCCITCTAQRQRNFYQLSFAILINNSWLFQIGSKRKKHFLCLFDYLLFKENNFSTVLSWSKSVQRQKQSSPKIFFLLWLQPRRLYTKLQEEFTSACKLSTSGGVGFW